MLSAERIKLSAEASDPFKHAVFQFVLVRKMAYQEYIFSVGQKMEVAGC
jgi:hypothetical protein